MKKIYIAILVIIFLVAILCLKISLTEYFQNEHFIDIGSIMKNFGIDSSKCEDELNEFKKHNSDLMNQIESLTKDNDFTKAKTLISKFSNPENQSPELQNLINCITATNNINMLSII